MEGNQAPGRARIHLICAILALLCLAAMFVPVLNDSSFGLFAGETLRGEAQYAYYYSTSGFTSDEPIYKTMAAALLAAMMMLLAWAVHSFKGSAGKLGLTAAIVNLLATVFVMMGMIVEWGIYRIIIPGAILVMALAAAAVVLAVMQYKAARPAKKE